MNWIYDRYNKFYITTDRCFIAQRETKRRWSLWRKNPDDHHTRAKLVNDYYRTLEHAKESAEKEVKAA